MKKFKFIFEGIVSPSNVTPAGGNGEGEGGKPNEGEGPGKPSEGEGPGKPGKPVAGDPGKGKLPINDMIPEGKQAPKGLPGSDASGDEKTDKETEQELKRKAHTHQKEVEAGQSGKATTKLGEVHIPDADYETILQDMLGSFQPRGGRSYTQGHRGNPTRLAMGSGIIPGRVRGKPTVGNVLIGIDTSGSITEAMLETYLGAITRVAEEHQDSLGTIRIVLYSAPVWHYIDFNPQSSTKDPAVMIQDIKSAIESGYSGGNDWSQTMKGLYGSGFKDMVTGERVNFNDTDPTIEQFNGFIFLTDCIEGNFENSSLPEGPTVFLIPTGGHDHDSESLPFVQWAKEADPSVEFYTINLAK